MLTSIRGTPFTEPRRMVGLNRNQQIARAKAVKTWFQNETVGSKRINPRADETVARIERM